MDEITQNYQNEELEPGEISDKVKKEIEKKIASLKAANDKLKKVYPIVVFGTDGDEKEIYIGYFKQPSFTSFSKYMAGSQANQAVATRTLAKECFIDGDKDLIDDDSLFLFGLMGQLPKIISMRHGTLANLSTPGK